MPARQDEILSASPQFLDALADADRLFCNMDRSISNPNILSSRGALYAIDFDACLFVRRAAQARYPSAFALPDGHFLSERSPPSGLDQLDPDSISEALHEAPDAWIAATHLDFGELERRLRSYIAAWNTR